MGNKYVAAFDQGTTSSRTILFDEKGKIAASAQAEFPQIYPKPGWVEHDPKEILSSQLHSFRRALKAGGIAPDEVAAIGIANQRETTLVWDKFTGKPVYNAIVWQCRRTSAYCEALKARHGKFIYERTGLQPDAYFSASKIRWILDNVPFARERAEKGALLFGTIDTYLLWHLTRGRVHATDFTNASRTMLFNIHTLQWDEELCRLFGVPMSMLPEVKASGADYGHAAAEILGAEIPLCAAVGDQQSALFGQFCTQPGDVKNTYGTGCFLLANTGRNAACSENGLITTLTASLEKPGLCVGRKRVCGGRGGTMAARWARACLYGLGDGSACSFRPGYGRRELCSGVRGAGRTALGPGMPRPSLRHHARRDARAHRAGGARIHRTAGL